MLINRHNCVQCCIKHLASAAVIAREIRNGYNTPEYRFYFIGNPERSAGADQRNRSETLAADPHTAAQIRPGGA